MGSTSGGTILGNGTVKGVNTLGGGKLQPGDGFGTLTSTAGIFLDTSVSFQPQVQPVAPDLHDVLKLKISTGAHWTFLADVDLQVQQALDIREYTDEIHTANVPHTLVLAPGLKVDKVYVGYWFWGRPSPFQLWEDLQDLMRRIKPDFDPTTPAAKTAWKKAVANGNVPAHR